MAGNDVEKPMLGNNKRSQQFLGTGGRSGFVRIFLVNDLSAFGIDHDDGLCPSNGDAAGGAGWHTDVGVVIILGFGFGMGVSRPNMDGPSRRSLCRERFRDTGWADRVLRSRGEWQRERAENNEPSASQSHRRRISDNPTECARDYKSFPRWISSTS